MPAASETANERRRWPRWGRWLAVVVVLLAVALPLYFFVLRASVDTYVVGPVGDALAWIHGRVRSFSEWVDDLGPWGPLAFVLGYTLLTVAMVPGSFLTLAAGTIFGLFWGIVWVFISACLGAGSAFLVARYAARHWVEKRFAGSERFARIDRAIGRQGLKITVLLRLSPVFPFNVLNYALGLTRVTFLHYNLASLAMLPGTILYVYYGSLAGDLAGLAADDARPEGGGWADWAVKIAGLVATIAVATIVARTARRALREETGVADESPARAEHDGDATHRSGASPESSNEESNR